MTPDRIEGNSIVQRTPICPNCGPPNAMAKGETTLLCIKCGLVTPIPEPSYNADNFENFVAHIQMLLDSPRELTRWKEELDSSKNELLTAIEQKKTETTIDELSQAIKKAIDRVKHYTQAVKALEALAKFIHDHEVKVTWSPPPLE